MAAILVLVGAQQCQRWNRGHILRHYHRSGGPSNAGAGIKILCCAAVYVLERTTAEAGLMPLFPG